MNWDKAIDKARNHHGSGTLYNKQNKTYCAIGVIAHGMEMNARKYNTEEAIHHIVATDEGAQILSGLYDVVRANEPEHRWSLLRTWPEIGEAKERARELVRWNDNAEVGPIPMSSTPR